MQALLFSAFISVAASRLTFPPSAVASPRLTRCSCSTRSLPSCRQAGQALAHATPAYRQGLHPHMHQLPAIYCQAGAAPAQAPPADRQGLHLLMHQLHQLHQLPHPLHHQLHWRHHPLHQLPTLHMLHQPHQPRHLHQRHQQRMPLFMHRRPTGCCYARSCPGHRLLRCHTCFCHARSHSAYGGPCPCAQTRAGRGASVAKWPRRAGPPRLVDWPPGEGHRPT